MASVLPLSMAISRSGRCCSRSSAVQRGGQPAGGIEGDQHRRDLQARDVEARSSSRPRSTQAQGSASRSSESLGLARRAGGQGEGVSRGRFQPPTFGRCCFPSAARLPLDLWSRSTPPNATAGAARSGGPHCMRAALGASTASGERSHGALLELAPLALAQPAPDAEPLVVGQGVLQALARGRRRTGRPSSPPASSRPSRGRTPRGRSARIGRAPASSALPRRRRPSVRPSGMPPRPAMQPAALAESRLRGTRTNNIGEITCLSIPESQAKPDIEVGLSRWNLARRGPSAAPGRCPSPDRAGSPIRSDLAGAVRRPRPRRVGRPPWPAPGAASPAVRHAAPAAASGGQVGCSCGSTGSGRFGRGRPVSPVGWAPDGRRGRRSSTISRPSAITDTESAATARQHSISGDGPPAARSATARATATTDRSPATTTLRPVSSRACGGPTSTQLATSSGQQHDQPGQRRRSSSAGRHGDQPDRVQQHGEHQQHQVDDQRARAPRRRPVRGAGPGSPPGQR